MEHPYVDLIAHPTGRLIGRRPPYPLDMEEVLQTAARTGTALELNANPNRWDLKPEWLRKAADYGVLVAVNTDAHTIAELEHMEFGVGVARKGWLKTENVLNTKSLSSLKHTLKRARFSH